MAEPLPGLRLPGSLPPAALTAASARPRQFHASDHPGFALFVLSPASRGRRSSSHSPLGITAAFAPSPCPFSWFPHPRRSLGLGAHGCFDSGAAPIALQVRKLRSAEREAEAEREKLAARVQSLEGQLVQANESANRSSAEATRQLEDLESEVRRTAGSWHVLAIPADEEGAGGQRGEAGGKDRALDGESENFL